MSRGGRLRQNEKGVCASPTKERSEPHDDHHHDYGDEHDDDDHSLMLSNSAVKTRNTSPLKLHKQKKGQDDVHTAKYIYIIRCKSIQPNSGTTSK